MIPISTSITHGLLICIPFTVFVAISFLWNPRLWLHSLPKDIQLMAPPKTVRERAVTRYVLLPVYLLILPGLSIVSIWYLQNLSGQPFSFITILAHLYIVWVTVHLWDLFVIDGLGLILIDRNHPPISGTEGAGGWGNLWFHVRSFVIATIMSALFVIPAAGLLYFLLQKLIK